jgi:UDP-N-acetylmuramate dehydrogenase
LPKDFSIQTKDVRVALSEVRGEVRYHELMARHTSMKIGGPADALVIPRDVEDLRRLVSGARQERIPVFLLGGTNLLVKDGGIRGIVVKMNHFQKITQDAESLYAEAGISFPRLSQYALKVSLSGLEFACGIPGTLGGAIVMNAGTREGEIADVLATVSIMDLSGNLKEYPKNQLEFGYRKSSLPEGIIVGALVKLKQAPPEVIRARMEVSLAHRRRTQPLELPNAGCIFKNPVGESAGHIIDELKLKGRRVGNAQISEKHANFIVNLGKATASDVLALIVQVRDRVKQEKGIELALEAQIVGEDKKGD